MPIMDVRYAAGSLDAAKKADLARRLTEVLVNMEGGAGTHGGLAFAWVLFTEVAGDNWWVGGRTDGEYVSSPGKFLVHVTIPEGYMNAAEKSHVHAQVTQAIVHAAVSPDQAAASPHGESVLVVIDEVTEGNWGAGGRTISLQSIADSVGLPKDGPRFGWVRAYFEAKARQFAAARYPPDVGGLFLPEKPGPSQT